MKRLLALLFFPLLRVGSTVALALATLFVLAAVLTAGPALGQWQEIANGWSEIQNAPVPLTSPSTGTLDIRPGSLIANNVSVTALATPTVTSVTPTLTKIGSITTVAGSALVDGDSFVIKYAVGLTVPVEFDLSPGNGTTGGAVPYVYTALDTADQIRDGLIVLLNAAAGTALTASSGGAATVSLVLDTPGAAGDTNTEAVANAGFAVTGFVNPTAATTYGYKAVSYLADGTSTAASAEVTTAAGHATLSASNFNTVVFAPSPGSTSTRLYRTTGGAVPPKLLYTGTATSFIDIGQAGTAEVPAATNTTGQILVDGVPISGGGSSTPGGSDTQVQYNKAGSFAGALGLTYTDTVGALTLTPLADAVPFTVRAWSSGTNHIQQNQDSANNVLSGWTHAGEPFLLAGKGAGKVLTSDADGVGTWAAAGAATWNSKTLPNNVSTAFLSIGMSNAADFAAGRIDTVIYGTDGTGEKFVRFDAVSFVTETDLAGALYSCTIGTSAQLSKTSTINTAPTIAWSAASGATCDLKVQVSVAGTTLTTVNLYYLPTVYAAAGVTVAPQ